MALTARRIGARSLRGLIRSVSASHPPIQRSHGPVLAGHLLSPGSTGSTGSISLHPCESLCVPVRLLCIWQLATDFCWVVAYRSGLTGQDTVTFRISRSHHLVNHLVAPLNHKRAFSSLEPVVTHQQEESSVESPAPHQPLHHLSQVVVI